MSSDIPNPGDASPPEKAVHTPQRDDMAPPEVPCECSCLHCGRTFMSDQMWFQRVIGDPGGFDGFWMCPTPNCGGAGFTFDIFPTDPDHPANEGWHSDEGDEEDEREGDGSEWDPSEPRYQALDEEYDEDDEDLEGEEWKHGLEAGERSDPQWTQEARREWEEAQRKYDEPDRRPRELDWSNRQADDPGTIRDDDSPF